jgi:adenosylhomocysteine nucleosidase
VNELTINDPCVVFALGREAAPFYREFRPNQSFAGAPCRARFCGPAWLPVLVLETGLGPDAAARALDWLLAEPLFDNLRYRPKVVLAAGFSGSLEETLAVGDIVLATDVADMEGASWPATWPAPLPPGEWRPPLHRGRLLSTPRLIGTPEEKRALGKQHTAVAVDMETAAIAHRCTQRAVPFGCVRAISDALSAPLSAQLAGLLGGARVSALRLVMLTARHPGLVGEMARLARDTRLAAAQLAQALGEILTLTLPWGTEL